MPTGLTPNKFGLGIALAMLSVTQRSAHPQAAFQNLGFGSATIVPIQGDPYGSVLFAPAFPGWTGTIGGVPQTSALYNNLFLDSSGIGILDQGWPFAFAGVIEGGFTAVLQAGLGPGSQPANASLS